MVQVGIVGIGFMGHIHYRAYQRLPGAKVAAIATRNEKRRAGDWTDVTGNFGPPGEQMDLSGIAGYATLDELLQDENVQLVDLCLPPDLHADAAVKCLEAGKHVLVEKPIALATADADRMMDAARAADRQLLVAHVLPFFPEYAYVMQSIGDRRYGGLLGGIFKRVISDPTTGWLKDFFNPDKVGGPVVDLHVHDAHFIRTLFGMPSAVFAQGRMRGPCVEFMTAQFIFDERPLSIAAVAGVIGQHGRPFTHAYEIHFEHATLVYDLAGLGGEFAASGTPLTVLKADGSVERPTLGSGDPVDAFVAELGDVVQSIETGQMSALLDGQLARDALAICNQVTASVKSGKAESLS